MLQAAPARVTFMNQRRNVNEQTSQSTGEPNIITLLVTGLMVFGVNKVIISGSPVSPRLLGPRRRLLRDEAAAELWHALFPLVLCRFLLNKVLFYLNNNKLSFVFLNVIFLCVFLPFLSLFVFFVFFLTTVFLFLRSDPGPAHWDPAHASHGWLVCEQMQQMT